jgi:hypothetical protein
MASVRIRLPCLTKILCCLLIKHQSGKGHAFIMQDRRPDFSGRKLSSFSLQITSGLQ